MIGMTDGRREASLSSMTSLASVMRKDGMSI